MSKLNLPRPARPVPVPGGGTLHVRSLTLAELRRCDGEAEQIPAGPEREVHRTEVVAAFALAGEDGAPLFGLDARAPADEFAPALALAVAELEGLTPEQLGAVVAAALPSKDDAKKA